MSRTLAVVLALTLPLLPASTAAPVPKAKPLVQKVDGFPKLPKLPDIREEVELDEIANIALTDVEIYYPDEKKWRACTYDGKTWNAPDGAAEKKIRLSGTYKQAVGGGLNKKDISLHPQCHPDRPKGQKVPRCKMDKSLKDGTFWVEFWGEEPGALVPRPPTSSGDGPTVAIFLFIYQDCIMGDRRISSMTVDLRTTITYPASK